MAVTITSEKKPRKLTNKGYINTIYATLDPFKFRTIDWKNYGYSSFESALGALRTSAKRHHLNDLNFTTDPKTRLIYVYRDNFIGRLPSQEKLPLQRVFLTAHRTLAEHPEINEIPFKPEDIIENVGEMSPFELRDILRKDYPFLTLGKNTKGDLVIKRDKSYGNILTNVTESSEPGTLCIDFTAKQEEPVEEVTIEERAEEANTPVVDAAATAYMFPEFLTVHCVGEVARQLAMFGYKVDIRYKLVDGEIVANIFRLEGEPT